jgi:hypothetical protein
MDWYCRENSSPESPHFFEWEKSIETLSGDDFFPGKKIH